jgi:hypothetical protein
MVNPDTSLHSATRIDRQNAAIVVKRRASCATLSRSP